MVCFINIGLDVKQGFGVTDMLFQALRHLRNIFDQSRENLAISFKHRLIVYLIEGDVTIVGVHHYLYRVFDIVLACGFVIRLGVWVLAAGGKTIHNPVLLAIRQRHVRLVVIL
ncbi:hypothetical protein SDC9_153483 [bioreactor metagenome]|uniref:Uncharacterized protein n=1 Tax=bioreactor metagenome TaxID=1076179 RepID=A0A645EWH6_9ZZZZ